MKQFCPLVVALQFFPDPITLTLITRIVATGRQRVGPEIAMDLGI